MNQSDQEKLTKTFDSVADMVMDLQNKAFQLGRLRGRREMQDKINQGIRVYAWKKMASPTVMAQTPGMGDDDSALNATLILDEGVSL